MHRPGPAALCSTSFTIPPPLPSRGRAAVLQDGRDQGGEQTSVDVNVCVTSFPFLPGLVGAVLLLYRRVTGCRNTWYRLPRSASSSPGGQANVRLHGPSAVSPLSPLSPATMASVGWQHRAHLLSPVTTHHHHTSRHSCRLQAAGHAS